MKISNRDLKRICEAFSACRSIISIDANNIRGKDFSSLDEAVESGQPFALLPRPHILVLDWDGKRSSGFQYQYEWAERFLRTECDNNVFSWKTGSDGHKHLVAVCRSAKHALRVKNALSIPDIRHGIFVRPPLSPHRLGKKVSTECSVGHIIQILSQPSSDPKLPERTKEIIRDGKPRGERSHGLCSVAASMEYQGFSYRQFVRIVSDPRNRISEKILECPARHRDRLIESFWKKGKGFVSSKLETANQVIESLREFVESRSWVGRTGLSDLSVLLSHLKLAQSAVHHASLRDVTLWAYLSRPTVAAAQLRLQAQGWLKRHEVGAGDRASVWEITVPDSEQEAFASFTTSSGLRVPESGKAAELDEELFRYRAFGARGLGKATRRVLYFAQRLQETNLARLRALTGLAKSTVWHALRKLTRAGLLFDGTVYDGDFGLGVQRAMTKRLGLEGAQQRIREIFAEQRIEYRTWYERRKPRIAGYVVGGVFHRLAVDGCAAEAGRFRKSSLAA